MDEQIAAMDDETLAKEIFFAGALTDEEMPEAVEWREKLGNELERREQ